MFGQSSIPLLPVAVIASRLARVRIVLVEHEVAALDGPVANLKVPSRSWLTSCANSHLIARVVVVQEGQISDDLRDDHCRKPVGPVAAVVAVHGGASVERAEQRGAEHDERGVEHAQ